MKRRYYPHWGNEIKTARIRHVCHYCRKEIQPKQNYCSNKIKMVQNYSFCLDCAKILDKLTEEDIECKEIAWKYRYVEFEYGEAEKCKN